MAHSVSSSAPTPHSPLPQSAGEATKPQSTLSSKVTTLYLRETCAENNGQAARTLPIDKVRELQAAPRQVIAFTLQDSEKIICRALAGGRVDRLAKQLSLLQKVVDQEEVPQEEIPLEQREAAKVILERYTPCQRLMQPFTGTTIQSHLECVSLLDSIDPSLKKEAFYERTFTSLCASLLSLQLPDAPDPACSANIDFYKQLRAHAEAKGATLEQIFRWAAKPRLSPQTLSDYELITEALDELTIETNKIYSTACEWVLEQFGHYVELARERPRFEEVFARVLTLDDVDSAEAVVQDRALFSRVIQLGLGCKELLPLELLSMASFINAGVPEDNYIKKDDWLPFSVIRDPTTSDLYFLLKSRVDLLLKKSSYKKVTVALRVLTPTLGAHIEAELVAQWVTHDSAHAPNSHGLSKFQSTLDELAIVKALQGKAGIWPTLYTTSYTKEKNGIVKLTGFSPLADFDLLESSNLTIDEIWATALLLAQGLDSLHAEKHYHDDLHPKNALFKRNIDGTIKAGLIDFGLSHRFNEPPTTGEFYGSVDPTPPERLGQNEFTGDYEKVEVWALGLIFYWLFFHKRHPAQEFLLRHHRQKNRRPVTEEVVAKFSGIVKNSIEKDFAHLSRWPQTNELNSKLKFYLLICKCLRLDPQSRLSLKELLQELSVRGESKPLQNNRDKHASNK